RGDLDVPRERGEHVVLPLLLDEAQGLLGRQWAGRCRAHGRDRSTDAVPGATRHWGKLLRQIDSALASQRSCSARTATLRAPWQPSTWLARARPGYPYPLASPAAAARQAPRTPRAARALAPRLARNLPQCQRST